MWIVRAILITLVIVCIVAFAFYNIDPNNEVDFNLIYVSFANVPLVTVVFWSFVAGVIVSLLLFISVYVKLLVQVRSARKRVHALESEVTVLRNRPIEESADLLAGADKAEPARESSLPPDN